MNFHRYVTSKQGLFSFDVPMSVCVHLVAVHDNKRKNKAHVFLFCREGPEVIGLQSRSRDVILLKLVPVVFPKEHRIEPYKCRLLSSSVFYYLILHRL